MSPVVLVYATVMDGTVVRWYRSESSAKNGYEMASASRNGVMVDMAPREIAMAAYDAFDRLRADRRADMSDLATHRRSFTGPPERIEAIPEVSHG